MNVLKLGVKVVIVAFVLLALADLLEQVAATLPAMPFHRLDRELAARQDAVDVAQWLQSPDAARVLVKAAALRYLLVVPLASLVAGLLGARLSVTGRGIVVTVLLATCCMVLVQAMAGTFALKIAAALTPLGRSGGGQTSLQLYGLSMVGAAVRLLGLVVSAVVAWSGYVLGKRLWPRQ